ncbi:Coiled-coil domain-containing protein 51 [Camponotus floridanus]|uniref:Coiled-coil domain-containing protein 51 n=2 Tax=Camponotus floridanus TaxID=104421 RepID=E2A0D5_CAMFO|nr:coiled-coil domain-containing protein 51 isoform X1 [Camponotus floridanus]EFN73072.1 Coiled-coil domain-containing protein 51 [Camponotus floridanus]
MVERYRQLLNIIKRKNAMFQHAKQIVENATEKAQNKFFNAQSVAPEKCDIVVKKLDDQGTVIMQDLNTKALQPSTELPEKIIKWWQWYNQLTGLNTVEAAKRQVVVIQDKLFQCQDNRRILNKELTSMTHKLQELYAELVQTKRDDPKFVHLTIMENKCLQEQRKVLNQLALTEKEESDNFTRLATAIKEYHDSQNLNAQKYKYLSILASAIIAIVSLIGSMILNNKRILDVRNTIKAVQEENESLHKLNTNELSNLKKILLSFDSKLSKQSTNIIKEKESDSSNNSSNILVTSAKYSAYLLISGASYIKKSIYACGSYIFYK